MNTVRAALRELRFRTPLRHLSSAFHRYDYNFTPGQLAFFVQCLDATRDLKGDVVEIGCATGRTTVFLNKHLDETQSPRRYVCVDTFSGFTAGDIEHETTIRGKARRQLDGFRINNKHWFDRNLADNGITRVTSVSADIKQLDLADVAPKISFALLDVDLYLPMKAGLEKLTPRMEPGGVIVVDDVKPSSTFDGAYQAYVEYIRERQGREERLFDKLGVIRF